MYRKSLYVYDGAKPVKVLIRNYKKQDFDALIEIQKAAFPPPFPSELLWNKEQLSEHVNRFPEGALCIEKDGQIIGSMTSLLLQFHPDPDTVHRWDEATDHGYIRNHQPDGNTLYVVDICVKPQYRKLGLGKCLMQSMYELVVHLGIERLLGGGRMPGYSKLQHQLTPQQYLDQVVSGELSDPVISFLLRCGRTPLYVVKDYLEDHESCNYAVLMEWKNPFYQSSKKEEKDD